MPIFWKRGFWTSRKLAWAKFGIEKEVFAQKEFLYLKKVAMLLRFPLKRFHNSLLFLRNIFQILQSKSVETKKNTLREKVKIKIFLRKLKLCVISSKLPNQVAWCNLKKQKMLRYWKFEVFWSKENEFWTKKSSFKNLHSKIFAGEEHINRFWPSKT